MLKFMLLDAQFLKHVICMMYKCMMHEIHDTCADLLFVGSQLNTKKNIYFDFDNKTLGLNYHHSALD